MEPYDRSNDDAFRGMAVLKCERVRLVDEAVEMARAVDLVDQPHRYPG
jgi:hypothetical protein